MKCQNVFLKPEKGFFLMLWMILPIMLSAQKGWEVGGWLGTAHYFGDLNTSIRVDEPGPAGGVMVRYNFNNRICLKGAFSLARVHGDDARSGNTFEKNRNLSFRTGIADWSQTLEFNFLEYVHGSRYNNFTPYLLGGFNVFYFQSSAEYDGKRYALRKLGTEGQSLGKEYPLINLGGILGLGFKWDINRDLSINIELSHRSLFTDYLDDVSGVYADKSFIQAVRGEVAAALSDRSLTPGFGDTDRQRGDRTNKDEFVFFGIGIVRYFGDIACPEISKIR